MVGGSCGRAGSSAQRSAPEVSGTAAPRIDGAGGCVEYGPSGAPFDVGTIRMYAGRTASVGRPGWPLRGDPACGPAVTAGAAPAGTSPGAEARKSPAPNTTTTSAAAAA